MTDEEQAAWDEDGIGQAPDRDPAGCAKIILAIFGTLLLAFVLIAVFRGQSA